MAGLGSRLKNTREDLGLSLKKFADSSKIPVKYLERLEGGQYEKLPAFVYVQGFLKKYSQALDLPVDELLNDYQKETGIIESQKSQNLLNLPELETPRLIITPKKIGWMIIGILVFSVAGYFIYQLNFLLEPPKLILDFPSHDMATESTSIELNGQSDAAAQLSVNGQQMFVGADGRFRQQINLNQGLNVLKIEAVNRFGKKSEIIRQIVVK